MFQILSGQQKGMPSALVINNFIFNSETFNITEQVPKIEVNLIHPILKDHPAQHE